MCHNKRQRRQARCGYGAGYSGYGQRSYGPMSHNGRGGGIEAIIGAVQQMRFGQQPYQGLPTDQPRAAPLNGQEKGVVIDEKKLEAQQQHDQVKFEELPSYDESTGASSPAAPRAMPAYVPVAEGLYPQSPPLAQSSRISPEMLLGQQFRQGLEQYRSGDKTGKWVAKRAAKQFVRDLKDQELAKRRGERGHLQCGEWKQIKRDLKPVKMMLKEAVWEAKRQRKEVY